jgi:cation transport regulator ChaB
VIVANLDPTLDRRPAPEDPLEAIEAFPDGLVTAEVAAIMTSGNDAPGHRGRRGRGSSSTSPRGRVRRTTLGNKRAVAAGERAGDGRPARGHGRRLTAAVTRRRASGTPLDGPGFDPRRTRCPPRRGASRHARALAEKVRDTYEKTLDSAHEQYDSEQRAHRTAWSAVKHIAEKDGDHWELKDEPGPSDPQSQAARLAGADNPKQTYRRASTSRATRRRSCTSAPSSSTSTAARA